MVPAVISFPLHYHRNFLSGFPAFAIVPYIVYLQYANQNDTDPPQS